MSARCELKCQLTATVQVSILFIIAAQLDLWATYGAQERTLDPLLSIYDAVFVSFPAALAYSDLSSDV